MKKYDIALSWNSGNKEHFVKWVRRECRYRKMRFLLINEKNVEEVTFCLEKGTLKIDFLLDNEADYSDKNNSFARLSYAVKDINGYVVCDPDDSRQAANKAITHYVLAKRCIPVPFTVVVRNWEPDDFSLNKKELKKLGNPFIIKPASGFGQKGVVRNASGSIAEIAQARHFNRGDDFLLQEKITPNVIGTMECWFRVYFLFGEIIPCWWNTETGQYAHVSLRDADNYGLLPLARIISKIAKTTNMEFFSSEIAVTGKGHKRRFVVIDYVNDQPELCVRSDKGRFGPVPEIVEHIAERVVNIAWRMKIGLRRDIYRSIWMAKAHVEDQSI